MGFRRVSAKLNNRTVLFYRSSTGSIMPLVAIGIITFMGLMGMGTDLMRDFECTRQLDFGSEAAGLYALSLSTNSDYSWTSSSSQANIQNAVMQAGLATWNNADSGPQGTQTWSKPVTFTAQDVQFVQNPLDSTELLVQVTSRRQGTDALTQFFLPYTSKLTGVYNLTPTQTQVSIHRITEFFGQPASRIGAGAPAASQLGTRAADLVGFAALPIAISNQQFAAITSPGLPPGTVYTMDILSSKTPTALPGHLKAVFVNDFGPGKGSPFYDSTQGQNAINQLIGLLNYCTTKNSATAPAVVERGSALNAFDPANATFTSNATRISTAASLMLGKTLIFPVFVNDPIFTGTNAVAGFARLTVTQVIISGTTKLPTQIQFTLGESVPVRNASTATGYATTPPSTTTLLPAPVYPFTPRSLDLNTNGLTVRPRGIVLAPALSPRQLNVS